MTIHANLELSRREALLMLDAGRAQVDRNRLGQFATPPSLAREIVRFAVSLVPESCNLRFLEPGFGTGTFFSALLSLVDLKQVQAAVGYEVDPYYGESAMVLWENTKLELRLEDFTDSEPPEHPNDRFNLVVCNPPYVRHHHLTQHQKAKISERIHDSFGFRMNGLSGLYTYFMVLSTSWMCDGGIGAWLVPSEFMDVKYGRKLKEFLLNNTKLLRIHRFEPEDVQFADAMVSSAVVVFQNSPSKSNDLVQFSIGGSLAAPNRLIEMPSRDISPLSKWSLIQKKSTKGIKKTLVLADFFSIKRGLATGDNSFFILDETQIERFCIPREFLIPILPSPRYLESDVVGTDEAGNPLIQRKRYLLSCDLSEEEVRERYPSLWEYYQLGMTKGIHNRYLCRHRYPWYSQESRPATVLLCSYMGRGTSNKATPFRFFLNHSNATAANVYLMLYPRPKIQRVLDTNPILYEEIWKILSSLSSESLTNEGRVYGGGLHKMEPSELGNVSAQPILDILEKIEAFKLPQQGELFAIT